LAETDSAGKNANMTARISHRERYGAHWYRTLIGVVMLALTAAGVYWNATVAIVIAMVCLVVGGARSIASVSLARSADPHTTQSSRDQAWAEEVLSRSLFAETLFTAFEFLAPSGVCYMIMMPPEIVLRSLWIPFWGAGAAIATAFALVVWERHMARRTLQLKSN
jgi:hypothetical protein